MPKITVDVAGEEVSNFTILPDGYYQVQVSKEPEIKEGKTSGKKYLLVPVTVVQRNFKGSQLDVRCTLEKGDNPKKSKRWLLHQLMMACGIEKTPEQKYSFSLDELTGKTFWVKVIVVENSFDGKMYEKNEVKQIATQPVIPKGKPEPVFADSDTNGSAAEDAEEIPF